MSCESLGCNCGKTVPCSVNTPDAEDIAAAKDFYANDQKKLESIIKTQFTPVGPYILENDDPWYLRVYYAIHRWIWQDLRYYHRDIQYGIRNLWRWLPFIWTDRNWDSSYLDRMVLKKLRYMQPEIQGYVMRGPHHDALDRCIVLLDEIIKRDNCNCHRLGGDCNTDIAVECYGRQMEMRRELGSLIAEFSDHWWN